MPIWPTPAAARYWISGEPRPPRAYGQNHARPLACFGLDRRRRAAQYGARSVRPLRWKASLRPSFNRHRRPAQPHMSPTTPPSTNPHPSPPHQPQLRNSSPPLIPHSTTPLQILSRARPDANRKDRPCRMKDPIVIVGAARTPMGGFQGDLKDLSAAPALGSAAIAAGDRALKALQAELESTRFFSAASCRRGGARRRRGKRPWARACRWPRVAPRSTKCAAPA